jgi:hypothetical protein
LVGLQYCPGCLRAIDGGRGKDHDAFTPEIGQEDGVGLDSFYLDIEAKWANIVYPLKSAFCWLFRLPEPKSPPPVPVVYRAQPSGPFRPMPSLALTAGYTRVVCPKCLGSQQAPLEIPPSEMIKCHACSHQFPGSCAAEFRKGADLQCVRCGVITFCISGLKITTCPNCRYSTERVTAKTRLKPKILATVAASIFVGFLANAVMTQTTTQFIVGTCLAIVGTLVGFVTMVALGF